MLIRKAYKFRLKPNKEQQALLYTFAGHTRFLWNKSLALCLHRLENKQPILYYGELDYWCKLWKASNEYGFLQQAPAHILQQKLRDLEKAFRDCFDKNQPHKRLPRFKKKYQSAQFRFPAPKQVKLEGRHISLPKLGKMRFVKSRAIKGEPKNYTISRRGKYWFVSIQVELELASKPMQRNWQKTALGLDMGIKHFVTTSRGEHIAPINIYSKLATKLANAQRKLKKKQRFSSNWKKQQQKIRGVHSKIADTRKDFLHKLLTTISKNHAIIVLEDLKVKNMSQSAQGTREQPGTRVAAKSGLNRAILDQGWSEFRRQLSYKASWRGGIVQLVNPKHTSQQCRICKHIAKENRLSQEKFACIKCHHTEHADVNAANNILEAGLALMACGASA